ncbi:type ISP restriction/modification enzyme [Candidatus Margulisiibacteriota bacterium]
MKSNFEQYIQSVSSKFAHKETSEMGYRADFEKLIRSIFESIKVKRIDHDPKAREGNKPDFIIYKTVPILYIEVKDIGTPLDKVEKSEQMARYYGYANLILTDYLEFRFYRNGIRYEEPIKIADYDLKSRTITPISEQYEHLAKTLVDFTRTHKEPIKSGEHLSKIMGGKAQRIRDNISYYITDPKKNVEIMRVYKSIKQMLVHDLSLDAFADMYAQTLVYGLFVARYYDDTPETFSRQEARDLVPKSNPLLRHFFDHIVGPNFDKRLKYIVNELCEVFSHADVQALMSRHYKTDLWGKTNEGPDPVIHFYEDFLKEYDSELRKKMGAFYTPLPVVRFIVRSVDYLLEKKFGLADGLADTSKLPTGEHQVQILDPAAGTGTFLAEVLYSIYAKFTGQRGRWPTYVHRDLLPRLNGFELMMAPYTIAHLKLGMVLKETGFIHFNRRLGIYLTNSLEGGTTQASLFGGFGFAESIAEESKQASIIKNKIPIMVIIGNPPYSISSSNKGEWIQDLIKVYKKGLGERKINIDDDYIKFIRLAEYFTEKNGRGIVAMITNNSFIDGITHRQMRKHLLETFDDIYIFNLHGNSKKKEKAPDGGKDENVFDIQQGVAISIFVCESRENKCLGTVRYAELYGKREVKFTALNGANLQNIKWEKLNCLEPYYFFAPKEFKSETEYQEGFKIDEFFPVSNSGVKTDRDKLFVDMERSVLANRIKTLLSCEYDEVFKSEFRVKDSSGYKMLDRLKDKVFNDGNIRQIQYRPFDYQWIYYDCDLISRPGYYAVQHILKGDNLALLTSRSFPANQSFDRVLVTKTIPDIHSASDQTYNFPLYKYHKDGSRIPNLKEEIVNKIEINVGKFAPEGIFDYIYAILHSPKYRKKYEEFLRIDFPRVPYPKGKKSFNALVALGAELRSLHLLKTPKVSKFVTTYPVAGSNVVEKVTYKDSKVFINKEQYFGKVPKILWNFYIGGYQPAQKWLKDRKGRTLANRDIVHYQKIIVSLNETERIMREIDEVVKF